MRRLEGGDWKSAYATRWSPTLLSSPGFLGGKGAVMPPTYPAPGLRG